MKYIIGLLFVITLGCKSKHKEGNSIIANYNNPYLSYESRIDSLSSESTKLYWPGSSVTINFEGSSIAALLKDDTGNSYYNVILDKDSIYILRPDKIKTYYTLAKNLKEGKHSIEIFKRTEPHYGTTSFFNFKIKGKHAKISPKSPPKKRKIEFYGNSITAGYAVEDLTGKDSPDSTYTNNYLSYAAITARHFNAEYHAICKSGIGIMVSWHNIIMPEMYDRLDPFNPKSKWDFSLYQPNVVVINLFQNDSWLIEMPENENFKIRFNDKRPNTSEIIEAYRVFVNKIRGHYPESHIICMLGNMDATREESLWPEYITSAVKTLNDPKIHTYFAPYKKTGRHPSVNEQKILANGLISFIETHINW
jgi:hypothetical protein